MDRRGVPVNKELPCQRCGELTLEDFLDPAPECCARERLICPACVQLFEDEDREEHAAEHFNARQHVDAESLGLR